MNTRLPTLPDEAHTAEPLPRSFYARPGDIVARELLGKVLVVTGPNGPVRARIVETEAYVGEEDLACHASRGLTRRTRTIYEAPGTIYVYLIYGMYHLFNVVAASVGEPPAVLVRGVEPLQPLSARTDGPGRLTRALGIDMSHNGTELFAPPVVIEAGAEPSQIVCGPRIGVDYAGAWRDAPLRFFDADSRFVSKAPSRKKR